MKRYNTKQAIQYVKEKYHLNYAESTFAKYRREGGGPRAMKLGGKVFYNSGDLDYWVQSARYISDLKRQGARIEGV